MDDMFSLWDINRQEIEQFDEQDQINELSVKKVTFLGTIACTMAHVTPSDVCVRLSARRYPEHPILLVICPLISLISSHMKELKSYGISAAY